MNVGGAQRLVQAFGAGMVERRRGDLIFVTSDVVAHPRPRMSAYVASKWGLEGFVTALQMELEGTGVRAVDRAPGPDADRHGHGLGPRGHRRRPGRVWTRWGLARHSAFLRPDGVALAIAHAMAAPRGTHLSVVEVQPEAPLPAGEGRGSSMTTETELREPPGCRAAKARTATSTSCSHDPIGADGSGAGRVRRRRRVHASATATSSS